MTHASQPEPIADRTADPTPDPTPDPTTDPTRGPISRPSLVHERHAEIDGTRYAWSIIVPEGVDPGGAALLFLHGRGECGDDGRLHLTVGLIPAIERHPERWPFVIIAPQKPTQDSEWEDHERAVLAMLDEAAQEGLYDRDRLAITGLSQGGHGTVMLAGYHAERFRAAAPVCGYTDRRFSEQGQFVGESAARSDTPSIVEAARRLSSMPLWLFHGVLDPVIPVAESRALFEASGFFPRPLAYTEFASADHNAWDPAYADPALSAWLVEHTR